MFIFLSISILKKQTTNLKTRFAFVKGSTKRFRNICRLFLLSYGRNYQVEVAKFDD